MFRELKQDFRHALRLLVHNPGFAAAATARFAMTPIR